MWKNERKIVLLKNLVLLVLCVAVIGGLLYVMKTVQADRKVNDQQLLEVSTARKQEQAEEVQQAVANIQAEYERDMATVAEYLPGVVCWGDTLTSGSSGNVSYPDILQSLINQDICDRYAFGSTIPSARDYPTLDWLSYRVSIPVVNMGGGNENTSTVLGRAGVVPIVTKETFIIPADTTPVPISLVSQNGDAVVPVTNGMGLESVTIAGVEGTLSVSSVYGRGIRANYCYSFTRSEAGEVTEVPVKTEVVCSTAEQYRDYLHVIWVGSYDLPYNDPSLFVERVRALVSRQTQNSERYILIGPCVYNGQWNGNMYFLDQIDQAMQQAFGNRYINLRKYLYTDGLSDAGITSTATDKADAAKGSVPTSFRSAAGIVELNGKAYNLIGRLVFDRMDKLGYFDEVRQELGITVR